MAGSINKVILVGNLGDKPEVKTMQSGDKIANFSVATSESWKDRTSGERKENTQWHRVVVFNQGLMNVCENFLRKGSKIYVEGQLETRKWTDKDGNERYSTEVVLRPYRGEITMLDSKGSGDSGFSAGSQGDYGSGSGGYDAPRSSAPAARAPVDELEDEIPF